MAELHGPKDWTIRGLLRWLPLAVFGFFGGLLLEENVREYIRENHWDSLLVKALDAIPDMSPLVASPWFWAAMWASGGFAAGAWLDTVVGRNEYTARKKAAAHATAHRIVEEAAARARSGLEQPPPPRARERAFTTKTVEQLLGLFDNVNPLQAMPLIEPFFGHWIKTQGVVMMTFDGGVDVGASLRITGRAVSCRFSKAWSVKLRKFDKGDAMAVTGQIATHQNGQQLYLINCELPDDPL
jgi:hypothetical protein